MHPAACINSPAGYTCLGMFNSGQFRRPRGRACLRTDRRADSPRRGTGRRRPSGAFPPPRRGPAPGRTVRRAGDHRGRPGTLREPGPLRSHHPLRPGPVGLRTERGSTGAGGSARLGHPGCGAVSPPPGGRTPGAVAFPTSCRDLGGAAHRGGSRRTAASPAPGSPRDPGRPAAYAALRHAFPRAPRTAGARPGGPHARHGLRLNLFGTNTNIMRPRSSYRVNVVGSPWSQGGIRH